nr:hypothetical protein [Tanacetum cinerariifolium]
MGIEKRATWVWGQGNMGWSGKGYGSVQDENYLCNLCGNNSHDDYDCQQQFTFVYEQEPSYNQNYDDNYYPHESPSYPCCDYFGGSHETFQCQPDNQNVDFSGSDQIQTPQYLDINSSSPGIKNPQILFQTWEIVFAIQCSQPEDSNESFQKLLEDLKELAEYDKSTNKDRPIFLNDNEDHLVQNKESPETSSKETVVSNPYQEPPQDSDMHQLIKECSIKNLRVIHKNSIISLVHADTPILSTKEPDNSLNMGYEHLSITPETESGEVTESNAKNLLPIPSECEDNEYVDASVPDPAIASVEENVDHQEQEEINLEEISQVQDVVLREKLFSINRLIANIESLKDNPTPICMFNSFTLTPIFEESDNSLSLPEFETFYDHTEETRSDNTTTHATDSLPEYDSFCFEIEPDQEELFNFVMKDISDDPSILRPPPELPDDDFDLEPEAISALMENIDLGGEIFISTKNEDVDHFPFMFVT